MPDRSTAEKCDPPRESPDAGGLDEFVPLRGDRLDLPGPRIGDKFVEHGGRFVGGLHVGKRGCSRRGLGNRTGGR